MESKAQENIVLLPAEEQQIRLGKVLDGMCAAGIDCALVTGNTSLYYLTGRVYSGYMLLRTQGEPAYIVKRPVHLTGENTVSVHKPEAMPAELAGIGITLPGKIGLELGSLTYNAAKRLAAALQAADIADISGILAMARATKTPYEIEKLRESGIHHEHVYRQIPSLYVPGMSDIELQVEIERTSRLDGCLGQFRIAGDDMELYMGNILAGDNADAPSPYDFAMGGAGVDPSLPVGANGTIIKPGMSVMVDMNGNYTGYMTDMTRCYCLGTITAKAMDAHSLSIDICHELARMGRPGTPAKDLYDRAAEMARAAGLEDCFMGHRQHAGFVGHGIGIEVNELPVLAPRSRNILAEGNIIAIEPKFVIPGTGAVGIENTYLVRAEGEMECLTKAPEQMTRLD